MHSRLARQLIVASLALLYTGFYTAVYAGTGVAAQAGTLDAPYSPATDDGSRI